MKAEKIVSTYLVVQAGGLVVWWALLWFYPASMDWFQPARWTDDSLLAFWLADFVLLIGGSVLTATWVLGEASQSAAPNSRQTGGGHPASKASVAIWSLAAVAWYPTLYCLAASLMTDEAWIASALMVSMAGLTLAMATIYGASDQQPAIVRATTLSARSALWWTLAQVVIFWGVFLGVIPKAIVEMEGHLGFAGFSHAGQTFVAIGGFATASLLGLWSGTTMATAGDGTPLPTATAPQLVRCGPYRFVRNPMALAGILQGVSVGWWFGSVSVIGYSLAGALVWHLFVRPVEEADLRERFGDDYAEYQRHVRLWVPSLPRRVD